MDPMTDRLWTLIEPAAEALGYQLVRVSFGGGSRAILQIMAERPDGTFAIEDCEALSRDISAVLDVEDPIAEEYVLEVSSPGIDRPLVRPDDYRRNVGFDAKITALELIDGRRRFTGRLEAVEEDTLVRLACDDGTYDIPFSKVEKAKLILTDALIKAHQDQTEQQH
ncbi:MAG: ribosome maturation factor RimP [Pseudomonadota bacterium]